ncbi:MAG TPA: FecR domain-containing protein [Rhizomicrobium sp.]|nr:FecR domain-containing protein [Rhizomicrobium sp.]
MSETQNPLLPPSRAGDIKTQAANWLSRANAGDWSEVDQARLDAWLAQSRAHRAAYWRLEAAWEEAARLRVLRAPLSRPEAAPTPRLFSPVKIAVAAMVIAITGALALIQTQVPPTERYATGIGGRQMLNLSDGSKIELNTNTILRVTKNTGQREVWLDKGEAFFQIKHDADHPFTVMTGDHKITDLGTKFSVRQDGDRLKVTLVEGRARLDSTGAWSRHQSVDLSPGDVVVATANSLSLVRKPEKALIEELGWRKGLLIFDHTTLADAVAEMNRYNTQKLAIDDPSVSSLTVDGTFPIHAVPEFTEVAQAVFGLRVEKRGDRTLISR